MENEVRQHALLSASSAHRWLACTPSARLEQQEEGECTVYAEEGTEAHELAEIMLNHIYYGTPWRKYDEFRKRSKYWTKEFEEYVEDYVRYIKNITDELEQNNKKYHIYIELRVNFSNFVPQGFGTADCLIVTEKDLHVLDLKFGQGVPVTAKGNPQMRLYALGTLNLFPNTENIKMTICQPRLDNFDTDTISKADLLNWALYEVKPKADAAVRGEGTLVAGEKQCKFCKLRGKCKARADFQLKTAQEEFAAIEIVDERPQIAKYMTPEQMADILEIAPLFIDWFKDVQKYAYEQALKGMHIEGFKLVEGKSNRIISDPDGLYSALQNMGYKDDDIFEPRKMKGISKIEALVGRKLFNEVLSDYVIKPQGAPTLVPLSDKRPEINTIEQAIKDFE